MPIPDKIAAAKKISELLNTLFSTGDFRLRYKITVDPVVGSDREWERAARGADDRMYPWGDEARPGDANFQETYEVDSERMGEDAVGSFPIDRSPLGVADLGGNVAEWVGDIIDRSRATTRIARGGYWSDVSLYALAAMRPVYDEERNEGVGVRVCAMPRTQ